MPPFGQVLQAGTTPSGEAGQSVNSGTGWRHAQIGDLQLGLSRAQASAISLRLQ